MEGDRWAGTRKNKDGRRAGSGSSARAEDGREAGVVRGRKKNEGH